MNVIATANTIAASTRFLFVLMPNDPDSSQGGLQGRSALPRGEALVHKLYGHRALADGGGDALDRARVDIADRKDPGPARLEEQRRFVAVFGEIAGGEIATGDQEAVLIHRHVAAQP